MGYYTDYKLTVMTNPANGDAAPDQIPGLYEELESEDACGYGSLMQFIDGDSDDVKWYDHETDMLAFSKRFPTVLFGLEGHGEETGDDWRKYFLDGKVQECRAKMVYEPFDLSKFIEP